MRLAQLMRHCHALGFTVDLNPQATRIMNQEKALLVSIDRTNPYVLTTAYPAFAQLSLDKRRALLDGVYGYSSTPPAQRNDARMPLYAVRLTDEAYLGQTDAGWVRAPSLTVAGVQTAFARDTLEAIHPTLAAKAFPLQE